MLALLEIYLCTASAEGKDSDGFGTIPLCLWLVLYLKLVSTEKACLFLPESLGNLGRAELLMLLAGPSPRKFE